MALTVKLLISATFLFAVMKAWLSATATATVSVLTKGRANRAQQNAMDDLTGKATVKATGVSVWSITLLSLMWTFL